MLYNYQTMLLIIKRAGDRRLSAARDKDKIEIKERISEPYLIC